LNVLGLEVLSEAPRAKPAALSTEESRILQILTEPLTRDVLIRQLDLPVSAATVILMQMELSGYIIEDNGVYRKS